MHRQTSRLFRTPSIFNRIQWKLLHKQHSHARLSIDLWCGIRNKCGFAVHWKCVDNIFAIFSIIFISFENKGKVNLIKTGIRCGILWNLQKTPHNQMKLARKRIQKSNFYCHCCTPNCNGTSWLKTNFAYYYRKIGKNESFRLFSSVFFLFTMDICVHK